MFLTVYEFIEGNRSCPLRNGLILLIKEQRFYHCGWHHSLIGILNSVCRDRVKHVVITSWFWLCIQFEQLPWFPHHNELHSWTIINKPFLPYQKKNEIIGMLWTNVIYEILFLTCFFFIFPSCFYIKSQLNPFRTLVGFIVHGLITHIFNPLAVKERDAYRCGGLAFPWSCYITWQDFADGFRF